MTDAKKAQTLINRAGAAADDLEAIQSLYIAAIVPTHRGEAL